MEFEFNQSKNDKLFKLLYNDKNIDSYIHTLDENFNLKIEVLEKVINLSKGKIQKKKITEKNINKMFSDFRNKVLKKKTIKDFSTNNK